MIEFRAQNGIANLYGIKQTDLPIYLYFNVVMIFFRPIGDVFNLSQLELFHGWKVYEYLVYSRYRFLQREMRWKVGSPYLITTITPLNTPLIHSCNVLPHLIITTSYYYHTLLLSYRIIIIITT